MPNQIKKEEWEEELSDAYSGGYYDVLNFIKTLLSKQQEEHLKYCDSLMLDHNLKIQELEKKFLLNILK